MFGKKLVMWESSCGLAGSTQSYYLKAYKMDKDFIPAPSTLGDCVAKITLGSTHDDTDFWWDVQTTLTEDELNFRFQKQSKDLYGVYLDSKRLGERLCAK